MEEIKKEPVTVLLILLNTLIFLVVEFTGGSENGQHMLECGAAYAPLILVQGQWYRMFSSMFLHFGAPHLINNMLVLFVLGQRLEPVTGKIKFFLIYIFGGMGGNMLSLFFDMYAGNASLASCGILSFLSISFMAVRKKTDQTAPFCRVVTVTVLPVHLQAKHILFSDQVCFLSAPDLYFAFQH